MKQIANLHAHIDFARRLTRVMDLRFNVLGIRFGIDPMLDIIPGLGNILATVTSFYLFWIAYQLRVPAWVYVRMLWNISVDSLFGVIPYIGIVLDIFFRSNVKNFALLESYFDPDILVGEVI
ncbi:MAG: DUF4112 domain-containing protein [Patescibacteria group bacterium]